jgi:hypothetical protein
MRTIYILKLKYLMNFLSMSSIVYVFLMGSKCKTSHEIWTKLEESFGGSISLEVESEPKELSSPSYHEELQVSSTSGRDDCSFLPPHQHVTCHKVMYGE